VRGECLQAEVLDAKPEPSRQFDRAHDGVDGQFDVDEFGLGSQERIVETDVVRHQRATAQHTGQIVGHVGERRRPGQHLRGQPVHVGGAGVDARIEQAREAALDVAVVTDRERGDADDASLPRAEPGRLDVDDRPAGSRLGGRSAPTRAHEFEDGTAG
jgi:hypothetical protein